MRRIIWGLRKGPILRSKDIPLPTVANDNGVLTVLGDSIPDSMDRELDRPAEMPAWRFRRRQVRRLDRQEDR